MTIDQTRYDAFWNNPERYRLTYECNLVPGKLPYGLARGIAMHVIMEESAYGRTHEEIEAILKGECPNSKGEMIQEPISDEPRANAWIMAEAVLEAYPLHGDSSCELIQPEAEFKFQIVGSPHFMAGKVDQILSRDGELWCGELKSANAKKRFDQITEEWQQKSQADFEILGARSLGFDVHGVFVRTVVEKSPVVIWPLDVTRTEHRLQLKMLNVHETCEIIETLRASIGSDAPWPHVPLTFPCNRGGSCEYERICGNRVSEISPADLEEFKERTEHLPCIADGVEPMKAQLREESWQPPI